jgi:hypothetical protein
MQGAHCEVAHPSMYTPQLNRRYLRDYELQSDTGLPICIDDFGKASQLVQYSNRRWQVRPDDKTDNDHQSCGSCDTREHDLRSE